MTPGQNPRVLILSARGTNRDDDLADAFRLAGAEVDIRLLTELRADRASWRTWHIVAVPGGFSHGDALGAGRLLGLDLATWFGDELRAHVGRGRPIIGICNGFQALVRAGLLPGTDEPSVLAGNDSGRFECRWVTLAPQSAGPWTAALDGPLRCPVAHGEGRWVGPVDAAAFRYADSKGVPAGGAYPANPNGSADDVAGVVDPTGQILGMMPHPENHVVPRQDPRHRPGRDWDGGCLGLFESGVSYARGL